MERILRERWRNGQIYVRGEIVILVGRDFKAWTRKEEK